MSWRHPWLISGPSAGADQEMDVRMIKQGAGPGGRHGEDGGRGSHKTCIGCQFLGGSGGTAEQEVINDLGMLTSQRPQGGRQSKGQQIMRTRQQAGLLLFQPRG